MKKLCFSSVSAHRVFSGFLAFALAALLAGAPLSSQIPFERLEMGSSATAWEGKARDVSNPESWEETRFELQEPVALFGINSSETRLFFWNDRLYAVQMTFPADKWSELTALLRERYGEPWKIDSLKQEGYWGTAKKMVSTYRSGQRLALTIHDDEQKEFHWRDLFRGALLYVILTLAGLFGAYFLIAYLWTSFCPRCKSFAMKLQAGVQRSNLRAYHTDASLFSTPNLEYDTTYTYKCAKCGHIRRDAYSGWWESYRKTKNNA